MEKTIIKGNEQHGNKINLSIGMLIVTLGIVFGDIGTSPLYVFKAMFYFEDFLYNPTLIKGAMSAIFWTLTLQTTIKYVIITLQADNHGEGGIFSLYTLIHNVKRNKKTYILAIIGGATLMADGMITCSITVTSAIEGLQIHYPNTPVVVIVLAIITALFSIQQLGTERIGKSFGPLMLIWFLMMGTFGFVQLIGHFSILESLNPYYAYILLTTYPGSFLLLGAIFLCTTGAEALYADLGHCGIKNIRISWIFVKCMLILNYLGQTSWMINQEHPSFENPFFAIMPSWFLFIGITLATIAAIIASQALISGTFTLVSEATSLHFFPKQKAKFTSNIHGQIYLPSVNLVMWLGCCFVVFFFKKSNNMEAAYGLAITITMLMTTALMSFYLYYVRKVSWVFIVLFIIVFGCIEISFLISNMHKFISGGWFTILVAFVLSSIMYVWMHGEKIRTSFTKFLHIKDYIPFLKAISMDHNIPKTSTQLIFFTETENINLIEEKTIYSIIHQSPKRADLYWFIHVEHEDRPFTASYEVIPLEEGLIYRIHLKLGFRVEAKVNQFFLQILSDMEKSGEINALSRYPSLIPFREAADYKFVLVSRVRNPEIQLSYIKSALLTGYYWIQRLGVSEKEAQGLNSGNIIQEYVPLSLHLSYPVRVKRMTKDS